MTPLEELIVKFEQLNEKFIELCCHHYRHRAKMPDELNQYLEHAFFEEYKAHHSVHKAELLNAVETANYILEEIYGISTPQKRRWWQFWKPKTNESAGEIGARVDAYKEQFFGELLARVDSMADNFSTSLRNIGEAAQEPPSDAAPDNETSGPEPHGAASQSAVKPTETWEENIDAIPHETLSESPQ